MDNFETCDLKSNASAQADVDMPTMLRVEQSMGGNSINLYVSTNAIFCLALVSTLANSFSIPNFHTSILDETRNDLMSYSLGGRSSTPPTSRPTITRKPTSSRRNAGGSGKCKGRCPPPLDFRHFSINRMIVEPVIAPGTTASPRHRTPLAAPTPPPRQRKAASNTFFEALADIERATYEAQAAGSRHHHSALRLRKIKENIKLAIQKRNYLFARQALGRGRYASNQLANRSGRKRRAVTNKISVQWFMESVEDKLGPTAFNDLLGVNDDVTMVFAIDDTGSMKDEIQAAKEIAKYIVLHNRTGDVDYILSPFNDPGTGPVTYKESEFKEQFISAIENLNANGGGDCPELTLKGIFDALNIGNPRSGSPVFVFTDASAKDGTRDNVSDLIDLAGMLRIDINFFTTGLCGSSASFEPFERLARDTCGHVFKLPSSNKLMKLKEFTDTVVRVPGATCLAIGEWEAVGERRKRSVSKSSYRIAVDDSTETFIVSVTTERMNPLITLKDPRGHTITSYKVSLSNGAIYKIINPRPPGTWTLEIERSGNHSYQVKGSSETNIDFEHYFVMIPTHGRSKIPIPVSHPLLGQKAWVKITIGRTNKVNNATLNLDLMSQDGRRLLTTPLTPMNANGSRYLAWFDPPTTPFRLKLRGRTKRGFNFERNSRNIVHPSHILIRVMYARNEFTVPVDRSGYVMFMIYNNGRTDIFDIKIRNRFLVPRLRRSSITVRQGRQNFFSVSFEAPGSAEPGDRDDLLVVVTGRASSTTDRHIVSLMVV